MSGVTGGNTEFTGVTGFAENQKAGTLAQDVQAKMDAERELDRRNLKRASALEAAIRVMGQHSNPEMVLQAAASFLRFLEGSAS